MNRNRPSIGAAAYVTATVGAALLCGALAAWAESKLGPYEREILLLASDPWISPSSDRADRSTWPDVSGQSSTATPQYVNHNASVK